MKSDQIIRQALEILHELGIPVSKLSPVRRGHVARAFLALAAMTPRSSWSDAKDASEHQLSTKRILAFGRKYLGETRSDGSYDNVRREDLKLLTLARVVTAAANKPGATTNDGTRGYGIHPEAASVARVFGTQAWDESLREFRAKWPDLAEQLERKRELEMIPIVLPDGIKLLFRPDPHNTLQEAVITKFLPLFGYGAEVLYVGDAAEKSKLKKEERLKELGMFDLTHDQLPDIVAYSAAKNWLYLVEAVTTANPITEERRLLLERRLEDCSIPRVYVTAFLDRASFKKFASAIAWETEVWLADVPEHLVHFNGGKFLGPHN